MAGRHRRCRHPHPSAHAVDPAPISEGPRVAFAQAPVRHHPQARHAELRPDLRRADVRRLLLADVPAQRGSHGAGVRRPVVERHGAQLRGGRLQDVPVEAGRAGVRPGARGRGQGGDHLVLRARPRPPHVGRPPRAHLLPRRDPHRHGAEAPDQDTHHAHGAPHRPRREVRGRIGPGVRGGQALPAAAAGEGHPREPRAAGEPEVPVGLSAARRHRPRGPQPCAGPPDGTLPLLGTATAAHHRAPHPRGAAAPARGGEGDGHRRPALEPRRPLLPRPPKEGRRGQGQGPLHRVRRVWPLVEGVPPRRQGPVPRVREDGPHGTGVPRGGRHLPLLRQGRAPAEGVPPAFPRRRRLEAPVL
mmetsp:Transcript_121397/g.343964  ORF Transcript_121397/g.343964 Transcript_121397/m.343964 type:complete len:359 (+) Transcript_121397:171-1247(+)